MVLNDLLMYALSNRRPSFGSRLGQAIGGAAQTFGQVYARNYREEPQTPEEAEADANQTIDEHTDVEVPESQRPPLPGEDMPRDSEDTNVQQTSFRPITGLRVPDSIFKGRRFGQFANRPRLNILNRSRFGG